MEVPEWDAYAHSPVRSGSGAKEMAISGGGGEGGHFQVFQRLWAPPGDRGLLQIPRAGYLVDVRRLAGIGVRPGD